MMVVGYKKKNNDLLLIHLLRINIIGESFNTNIIHL